MADRPRIPLSFGGGMDRATGVFDIDAENFVDLRNVYLYRNRLEARKGMAAVNTFVDDAAAAVDDVVLIEAMRSEQMGVVVGYQNGDRELHVYRVDGDGTGTDRIGAWGILPANAHEPPRVIATESYRKLFLAHDEVVFSRRLSTYYYDPLAATQLVELTADLDGGGAAPVYFRGVTRHLNYVVGWGFGTASEQSRPEIVRISMPADPTSWDGDHFVIAGVRDDPVLDCQSMGTTPSPLTVFKGTETYTIFGYDRRTFGIRRIDDIYGLAAARLAVTYNGICYFWSLEGPRVTDGNGPSKDLSWPLDLSAPAPATLVAEGALEDGFAAYLPGRRVILFTFGKRQYSLSLWNPEDPKWSYGELGYEVFCGGRLSSGGTGQSVPPTAAPSAVTAPGKVGTTDTITVAWTKNSIDGDEFVEIWMKEESQTWVREKVVAASGPAFTDVETLTAGKDFDVSLRYRRGPHYSPNSADASDPSAWPAAQQVTGGTLPAAPTLDTTSWDRVSAGVEKNVLNWTNTHADKQTKIYRDGGLIDTVNAGVTTYDDTAAVGESDEAYTLKHVTAGGDSVASNEITQWTGPDQPPSITSLVTGPLWAYDVDWTNGDVNLVTEVWSDTPLVPWNLDTTEAAGVTDSQFAPAGAGEDDACEVRVRHKKTEFAVNDYSKYDNAGPIALKEVP